MSIPLTDPFVPRPALRGGHKMTLYAWANPRYFPQLPPPSLAAVAAVSPIIEIGPCVRALERPDNAVYEWNFVKDLKRRMRRKNRFWPGLFDLDKLHAIRTVREFDRAFTA